VATKGARVPRFLRGLLLLGQGKPGESNVDFEATGRLNWTVGRQSRIVSELEAYLAAA
jgi:hypothetical protein